MHRFLFAGVFLTITSCAFCGFSVRPTEDIEFAVTAANGQTAIDCLQTGYDGAHCFQLSPWRQIAQTFTVSSNTVLGSVKLRIGDFNGVQCSGQFEVAVYGFNPAGSIYDSKLAYAVANAGYYDGYDLLNVPVSTFDLSSFNTLLQHSARYALTITPLESFTGRLSVQMQANNYSAGQCMLFDTPIPEPATLSLLALGACLLRRKQ